LKVDRLLGRMTLAEKLEQLPLLADNQVLDANGNVKPDDAIKGLGGVFSLTDPAKINQLQHIAVDQSRLHTRSCSPSTRSTGSTRP
jgi:beta-glucosidase